MANPLRAIFIAEEDIRDAELRVIKVVQREVLQRNDSKTMKKLLVSTDEQGLLGLKTKLDYSDLSDNCKAPIVLTSNHLIVHKLIMITHLQHNHAGVSTLLCLLREKYWILKGRRTVKAVISRCNQCKRQSAKPLSPPFAPLPADRVRTTCIFETTGVDLAGLLILRRGRKAWVVLFTCAVFRAVHLEVTESLTTAVFLMALRRFIARQGRIRTLYSDNGANFVGAHNVLAQLDWEKIREEASIKRISWKFIPPSAAWWGGWWERLVGLLNLLRRNLGKSSVTYEELVTLMCDCESTLNERPQTYVADDPDFIPLTPASFFRDIPSADMTDLDIIDGKFLKRRMAHLQKLRENLRSRFKKEYLALLIHKGKRKNQFINIGDVVLIGSDNLKRVNWPIGKVIETLPGPDGHTRVARLKTATGEIVRPLQRLYPLEMAKEEDLHSPPEPQEDRPELDVNSPTRDDPVPNNPAPQEDPAPKDFPELPPIATRSGRIVKKPKLLDL